MIITDVDMEAGRNIEKELQVIGVRIIEMMMMMMMMMILQDIHGTDRVKFLRLDVRSEENWTLVWDQAEEWLGDQVSCHVMSCHVMSCHVMSWL